MAFYKTQSIGFGAVPVTLGTETQWRAILSLSLGAVSSGQVISGFARGQVTNNLGYNVEVAECATVIEAGSAGGGYPILVGDEIFPIAGSNLTPAEHYRKVGDGFCFEASKAYQNALLLFWVRGRSSSAQSGHELQVNIGQWVMAAEKGA